MAKKKFLQEDNEQVWPITRADCVYTVDGNDLLSDIYANKEYLENNIMTDEELRQILEEVFSNTETNN